jgi:hypothetical protein
MREFRSSGSVEGVMGNHDPYSDAVRMTEKEKTQKIASGC